MIAPRTRLLFWVAVIVLPFTLLMAIAPGSSPVALAIIALLFIAAVTDAVGGLKLLQGISLELPPVIRMSKDRNARVEVRVFNPLRRKDRLRIAIAWPAEIKPDDEEVDVALPADSERARLSMGCLPLRRGNYALTLAFVERGSPLGLWAMRKRVPLKSELRVYPNLLTERKSLAALFLNRGGIGFHTQRQVGKGREFEKLREYVPGDDFEDIHWKATARRSRPITKVFQIEKAQEVYVVVDTSRLTARKPEQGGDGENTVLERFVTASLILALAAERQGDLFGMLTFADRVEKFVRAKNGQAHFNACRDSLYALQPGIVTPDFDELCAFIRLRLRRRALLVFLTALDDPAIAESFVRNVELIRRQHLVLVNMVRPPGMDRLFARPDVADIDDLYQRLGGHLQWRKVCELQKVLRRRTVQFSILDNERLSADVVSQYLGVKRRQAL